MLSNITRTRLASATTAAVRMHAQPVRHLNLHEYQSKELLAAAGVTTQRFKVAKTPAEAKDIAQWLKSNSVHEFVIKAQIHAGGRGKGTFSSGFKGGVQLTKDPNVVGDLASKMIGYNLVTKQTPPAGVPVNKLMVAEALDIASEKYFAIVLDRESQGPVLVASPQGGVDIEEVAAKTPELIFKEPVKIAVGVTSEQALRLAKNLGFTGAKATSAADQIRRLYDLFIKNDASQVEINPMGETPDGRVVCFDAKVNIDDNAEFRQKTLFEQRDTTEDDPREVEATKAGLNYVGMEGNIGCLVNGAGLAMATMDIIKLFGGQPANFLDVGGSVKEAQVAQAFKIITSDPQVKALLVNIFGGIVNCATIANGIVAACKTTNLSLPLVVRLEGTNVDNAKKILKESGLPIITAENLNDAAQKAVAALKK
ncbi:Suclg2 protein [Capsaspora owczarzaki ATCC 30864]|uniref:Succinate-CoA ligase subunit beta n=1 Tax=Capsaspora owczarzaki (strain ATCC 30864) TaxID=595528 RepID=A0A0D2X2I5_CAPO3|nr:Suclg2 protein [Capsaspora owczarzaki ATCC 30864]KJE92619.1 Suclg2 protein [Capsaspora owczarzaki ATCC 30864]|eukprot:XP_004348448.1 Suclg2 protein [Capsaspora owczarzaki ATCC 30864]